MDLKMSKPITIALAGNPNSGKTTLFNALTGERQHVGNYPGVTVEKKEGRCTHKDVEITIVDLPGTYSLSAYSVEELVARDFLLEQKPDVVVDIVDASNLERNLYLAVQLIELRVPLVLAFNMSDVARARGIRFDLDLLSHLLGAPIIRTVANRREGIDELLDEACRTAREGPKLERPTVRYGREIETELRQIERLVSQNTGAAADFDARWISLKLLEGDRNIRERFELPEAASQAERSTAHLETVVGDSPEVLIADRRYGFISGACQEAVRTTVEARHTLSDKIDVVLTNQVLGLPIFALLMYLVFQITFTVGGPCVDFLEGLICGDLASWVSHLWPKGSTSPLRSLIVDGVIGGVGAVVVFVPLIALLFLAIALLEDSGYMARAAFVMDRWMHKIGLHGKSFVPLLIGFGCTVPAILATRTLESRRDRLTTMLVAPLMSCGARLPIYMLIIPAFFPKPWHTPILWGVYLLGIVLAIIAAKVLRKTVLRGETTPFVMELPLYRVPTLRGLFVHMWDRTWMYLRKAGTVIFALAVVLWAANTFPRQPADKFSQDYDAQMQQAEDQYLAGAGDLENAAGIPSSLLTDALRAEQALVEAGERFWPTEEGYLQALREHDASLTTLKAQPGGGRLAALLSARDQIRGAREEFEDATQKMEPEAADYRKLSLACDAKVNEVARDHPGVRTAALALLDEVRGAYDARAREIRNHRTAEQASYAVSGRIGRMITPALRPIGLGNWRVGTALIGAFAAKEMFVSQMGILYSLGEDVSEKSEGLRKRLREDFTPLQGLCIVFFCLITAPCVATIAVTRRESGSWGWALFQLGGLTVLAYVFCLVVFQVGRLIV
jgi:ferrous iron transport protein B